MNVARTVQELEDAGPRRLHIEDQVNPKRCGHLDGKSVRGPRDTALKRIRAAADARRDPNFLIMARTDVRARRGLAAAIDRAKALVDAGADAIFPEAMQDARGVRGDPRGRRRAAPGEHDRVRQERLFTAQQLADVGVNIVIFPVSCCGWRWARPSAGWKQSLRPARRQACSTDADARELYELIDYEGYNHFDQNVFNFRI